VYTLLCVRRSRLDRQGCWVVVGVESGWKRSTGLLAEK